MKQKLLEFQRTEMILSFLSIGSKSLNLDVLDNFALGLVVDNVRIAAVAFDGSAVWYRLLRRFFDNVTTD